MIRTPTIAHYQKWLLAFLAVCTFWLFPIAQFPVDTSPALANDRIVDVHFFYSSTCPHCAKEKPLLEAIDRQYSQVNVRFIEVRSQPKRWQEFRQERGISSGAVPRTVIGDRSFIGYSNREGPLEYNQAYSAFVGYRNQIIQAIEEEAEITISLSDNGNLVPPTKKERFPWKIFLLPAAYLCTYPLLAARKRKNIGVRPWLAGAIATIIITLFLGVALTPDALIKEAAQGLPFPLFVFTVALADGFNPCAFTVLIVLLSLLTYTKNRRDMAIVGTTFIATSAIVYFAFIMLMVAVGSVFWENLGSIFFVILGGFLIVVGAINIKDYFFFKQGVSLSISESDQRTFSKKASSIVRKLQGTKINSLAFISALTGTIFLAVFVNTIELGCTAILPTAYMAALLNYCQENSWLCWTIWTGFYGIIYALPLLAILLNFIYSFQSARMSERQGRILKLASGLFMVFFGSVMLLKPELLMLA
jgi:thiol-disulfide isomerase/thioredoxin